MCTVDYPDPVKPWHMHRRGNYGTWFVCVLQVYMPQKAFIQISTGFTEDFQLIDSPRPLLSKVSFSLIFDLLALYSPRVIIAHAHALTGWYT